LGIGERGERTGRNWKRVWGRIYWSGSTCLCPVGQVSRLGPLVGEGGRGN
jgi:hypothetical protein